MVHSQQLGLKEIKAVSYNGLHVTVKSLFKSGCQSRDDECTVHVVAFRKFGGKCACQLAVQ
jgi:hypothetical protein